MWLGDNVYPDTEGLEQIQREYNTVLAQPGYQRLSSRTTVLGTWDDHDYGARDAGKEFSARQESQQQFLDFLAVPQDSPRRHQAGVFSSKDLAWRNASVRIILLDTRYHRDAFDSDGTVLGQEQWQWLEHQLASSKALVNIIASSIQVVPDEHPYEKWGRFSSDQRRLLELFANTSAKNLIVLSGDRHMAEISRLDLGPWTAQETRPAKTLYEVTSSSLSRSSEGTPFERNRYRIGDVYRGINFGTLTLEHQPSGDFVRLSVHDSEGATQLSHRLALTH